MAGTGDNSTWDQWSSEAKDFALAEYSLLSAARIGVIEGTARRFNFYLLLISVTSASLSLIAREFKGNQRLVVSLPLIVAALVLGIASFVRLIDNHVMSTTYTRAINRLRGGFARQHPNVQEYLVMPTSDARPLFWAFGSRAHSFDDNARKSSLRLVATYAGATGIVNSLVAGSAGGLAFATLRSNSSAAGLAFGTTLFLASELIHFRYHSKRLRTAESEYVRKLRGRDLLVDQPLDGGDR